MLDNHAFDVRLDMMGSYQTKNIVTATAAIDFLHEETPISISRRAYLSGMGEAAKSTYLAGRWQKIASEPLIICDTGHNADGLRYVTRQLESVECAKRYCVLGFAKDKNIDEILPLFPKDAHYIFTRANVERAIEAEVLVEIASRMGMSCEAVVRVPDALQRAKELATAEDMIFVGGSNFVVAVVL